MSDCGVCLYIDDCASSEFSAVKIVRARKAYECSECSRKIEKGENYEYASGKAEGEFWSCQTCLICSEIANAFYCNGRMYGGGLWEEMDSVWGEMTTGCLMKLTTAAAKAEVVRRWNEWKFRR